MMIGCLQWAVSLGRFDIQTSTTTMSRFRTAPRIGHLNRLKRMYGYLKKFASAAICARLLDPDLGELTNKTSIGATVFMAMYKKSSQKMRLNPLAKQ
jgi:hypothetical protein